eukprot:scaffold2266_cov166-Ochromonas_danica.AAC.8
MRSSPFISYTEFLLTTGYEDNPRTQHMQCKASRNPSSSQGGHQWGEGGSTENRRRKYRGACSSG